ncbi:MAG: hypothetical protein ABI528_07685 [bacterium]
MGNFKYLVLLFSAILFLYSFSSDGNNENESSTGLLNSLDPETLYWLERVDSAGGSVSDSVIAAIDDYVKEVKGLKYQSVSIRNQLLRENWFTGDFNSAFVPLFRNSNGSTYISGGYKDVNYNYPASSYSDTGHSSGLAGNGTNRFVSTGFTPFLESEFGINDARLSIYSMSEQNDPGRSGCRDITGKGFYYYPKHLNGNSYLCLNTNTESNALIPSPSGYIMMQRSSQQNSDIYYKDNIIASTQSNVTNKPVIEMYIGAFNNNGAALNFMTSRLGGYSIGRSFTLQQENIHYNAVQRLMNRLGRQTSAQNEIDFKSKLFNFTGNNLVINYEAHLQGYLKFELQNASGTALTNFSINDCPAITGSNFSKIVTWNAGSNLSSIVNTPVYLRIVMSDADLYSLQFKNQIQQPDSIPNVFSIGTYKQFFADTLLFSNNIPALRKMNTPVKNPEPVISPTQAWEGDMLITTYSNIDYSYSSFADRMVYKTWLRSVADGLWRVPVYYESVDGTNWTRPNLESYKFNGNTNNNIISDAVFPGGLMTVVNDSAHTTDSTRRYKSVYNMHTTAANSRLHVSFSYDGFIWTPYSGNPVRHIGEDLSSSGWNPVLGKYLGYFRDSLGIRNIGRYVSDDWINWIYTGTILKPDIGDIKTTGYYNMQVLFKDSVYWGFLGHFQMNANGDEEPVNPSRTDNTTFIELLFSRDGINFTRCGNRQAFINYGGLGEWDDQMIYTIGGPVNIGNEFYIYYNGFNFKHMGNPPPPADGGPLKSHVGLAKIGVDRFVSLKAY